MDKTKKWVALVLLLTLGATMTTGGWSALLSLMAFSLLFYLVARRAWTVKSQSSEQETAPQWDTD
ncbi:hypothetical protein L6J37_14055 [Photobacterium sp. WH77]|uniref:Uncharacterized protein n=1 Tax=Photobacterium arenosum TaxID=2774143 RepID=A0ABR9BF56_9GAMM|nr:MULTISPECIES: hypothetical protein [Photobacterium]MBD8511183.1 hypothetical protein [Photobacterium arenosum]MBV7263176.1 hypothetical protein [Photobacterium sp. WH24]MCG2837957.1 hypothetical protein [Photobacterium sp. WH77]MCG2845575.1 hypothetical protein [Photobacterium sp. WH80]MDO6581847.1 hypothetical protein [Photobacterium sp. 2_MG-2023]